jgi:hypothetical protein
MRKRNPTDTRKRFAVKQRGGRGESRYACGKLKRSLYTSNSVAGDAEKDGRSRGHRTVEAFDRRGRSSACTCATWACSLLPRRCGHPCAALTTHTGTTASVRARAVEHTRACGRPHHRSSPCIVKFVCPAGLYTQDSKKTDGEKTHWAHNNGKQEGTCTRWRCSSNCCRVEKKAVEVLLARSYNIVESYSDTS